MTDVHSKETRSYNMSQVHSKDTKIEEIVRKYLFARGLRYRKNDKRYPGHPDLIFPKYKTAVFVNGCFWHVHEGYPCFSFPKTNTDFWRNKLGGNQERDIRNYHLLKEMGWKVIVVWQCELKSAVREKTLDSLYHGITETS